MLSMSSCSWWGSWISDNSTWMLAYVIFCIYVFKWPVERWNLYWYNVWFCRCYPHKLLGFTYQEFSSAHCPSRICLSCMFHFGKNRKLFLESYCFCSARRFWGETWTQGTWCIFCVEFRYVAYLLLDFKVVLINDVIDALNFIYEGKKERPVLFLHVIIL